MLYRATILVLFVFLGFIVPVSSRGQSVFLRGGRQVDLVVDPVRSPVAIDASTKLMWKSLRRPSKILVSTSSPGQQFSLTVIAERVKWGVAIGTVQLLDGMPATELVVDAGRNRNGQCTLRYTASASPRQGIGEEVHTVTYTVTEQ